MLIALGVITLDIPDLSDLEELISSLHLGNGPVKSTCSLLTVSNDRTDKMRDAVIYRELYDLRVDEDHPDVVGRSMDKDTGQYRIDTY